MQIHFRQNSLFPQLISRKIFYDEINKYAKRINNVHSNKTTRFFLFFKTIFPLNFKIMLKLLLYSLLLLIITININVLLTNFFGGKRFFVSIIQLIFSDFICDFIKFMYQILKSQII